MNLSKDYSVNYSLILNSLHLPQSKVNKNQFPTEDLFQAYTNSKNLFRDLIFFLIRAQKYVVSS